MTNMHETHERTGATPAQIEDAAHSMIGRPPPSTWDQDRIDRYLDWCRKELNHFGQWLVPPGTVIVPEAVLTAGAYLAKYYLKDGNRAVVELDRMEAFKAALAAMGGEG